MPAIVTIPRPKLFEVFVFIENDDNSLFTSPFIDVAYDSVPRMEVSPSHDVPRLATHCFNLIISSILWVWYRSIVPHFVNDVTVCTLLCSHRAVGKSDASGPQAGDRER